MSALLKERTKRPCRGTHRLIAGGDGGLALSGGPAGLGGARGGGRGHGPREFLRGGLGLAGRAAGPVGPPLADGHARGAVGGERRGGLGEREGGREEEGCEERSHEGP